MNLANGRCYTVGFQRINRTLTTFKTNITPQRNPLNLTSLLAGVGSGAALGFPWHCIVSGRVGYACGVALLLGV